MPRQSFARHSDDDTDDDGRPTQLRTPASAAPITKPAGAMNSAFDVGAPPPSAPTRGRKAGTPVLDLNSVEIMANVPLPPRLAGSALTVYARLWDRIPLGGMAKLPTKKAASLVAHVRKNKAGHVATRVLTPGTTGVWKLAAPEATT